MTENVTERFNWVTTDQGRGEESHTALEGYPNLRNSSMWIYLKSTHNDAAYDS